MKPTIVNKSVGREVFQETVINQAKLITYKNFSKEKAFQSEKLHVQRQKLNETKQNTETNTRECKTYEDCEEFSGWWEVE